MHRWSKRSAVASLAAAIGAMLPLGCELDCTRTPEHASCAASDRCAEAEEVKRGVIAHIENQANAGDVAGVIKVLGAKPDPSPEPCFEDALSRYQQAAKQAVELNQFDWLDELQRLCTRPIPAGMKDLLKMGAIVEMRHAAKVALAHIGFEADCGEGSGPATGVDPTGP